ncbi:MAG: peptide chain release factor N(5)-glutamine methyltransferase [Deinococcales bacterium]
MLAAQPLNISEALTLGERALRMVGIDSAKAESLWLLSEVTGLSRNELFLASKRSLELKEQKLFLSHLERRRNREPLQYILGHSYFYGLRLKVTSDVLIPRPETESLVELALNLLKGLKQPIILDLGTGSGAIALSLKHERPDAEVIASDISAKALEVAQRNASELNLKIDFYQADLFKGLEEILPELDLLISNPPYLLATDEGQLAPELSAEPALALYAGEDGLDVIRPLILEAKNHLKKGVQLLIELDPRAMPQSLALAKDYAEVKNYKDLLGRERFLWLER